MPVLQFKGKTAVECYHHTVPHHTLEFDGKLSMLGNEEKPGLDGNLISQVDIAQFDYTAVDWDMSSALATAKDSLYRLTLEQDTLERVEEREAAVLETDEQVKAWLVASLPFDHFSYKQLRDVVRWVTERLYQANPDLPGRLGLVKFLVRDKIVGLVERETDRFYVLDEGEYEDRDCRFE